MAYGHLGKTKTELTNWLRKSFPEEMETFSYTTINKHVLKKFGIKKMKPKLKSTKNDVLKVFVSTVNFSFITTTLLKNRRHVVFIDGFS